MPFTWATDPAIELYFTRLPEAVLNTLLATAGALVIGLIVGVALAAARLSRRRVLSISSRMLIDIGRSIPILVVIYLVYFGVLAFSVKIEPLYAGTVAIGAKLSLQMAELFRAGIQSVPPGHVEAAFSLGMSEVQVQRRVVLPVAIRLMLPAIGQYAVGTFIDSSYVSVVGAYDLTGRTGNIIDAYFATDLWWILAITYFAITFPASRLLSLAERRIRQSLAV